MSSLSFLEKHKLERVFEMESGYVLNFYNSTFDDFFKSTIGVSIFDKRYDFQSGSKANRLRGFWNVEDDYLVARLIKALLAYKKECIGVPPEDLVEFSECELIADRLSQHTVSPDLDLIERLADDKDFSTLAKLVRETIENGEPETGIDRLHTFAVKYLRIICKRHGIDTDKNKPLHSLIGEYIKAINKLGLIESEMTERILKTSISVLESFNKVRNDQSLAHDNVVLNRRESLLIFSHVSSTINFIESIEAAQGESQTANNPSEFDEDIPF